MRILYRYKKCGCDLDNIIQMLYTEDPTIINADYCTAPSWNNVYLTSGLLYHPTYYSGYELDGADRVFKTFTTYPLYIDIYYQFMQSTPYRSIWVDSDCDGTKDALSKGSQVTIGKFFTFTEDKTITVGIFGDNQFQINYDGETIMSFDYLGRTVHTPFRYLNLFEVNVTAGTHYLAFTGTGDGSVTDALGVIVFDHPIEEILIDEDPPTLNELTILYSSEESLSEVLIL